MSDYIVFGIFIQMTVSVWIVGWQMTESRWNLHRLLKLDIFERKPFGCAKCLTFHLEWVIGTFVGLFIENQVFIAQSIAAQFVLYRQVELSDNITE